MRLIAFGVACGIPGISFQTTARAADRPLSRTIFRGGTIVRFDDARPPVPTTLPGLSMNASFRFASRSGSMLPTAAHVVAGSITPFGGRIVGRVTKPLVGQPIGPSAGRILAPSGLRLTASLAAIERFVAQRPERSAECIAERSAECVARRSALPTVARSAGPAFGRSVVRTVYGTAFAVAFGALAGCNRKADTPPMPKTALVASPVAAMVEISATTPMASPAAAPAPPGHAASRQGRSGTVPAGANARHEWREARPRHAAHHPRRQPFAERCPTLWGHPV